MQQIPVSLLTLLAGVLVTLVSLWVGQHHGLLPEQASEQAPLVDGLFDTMVTIGTALFIVIQGAIVIFMIRYRKPKDDDTDGVPLEGNLPLEIVWTAIPAVIVIGLGIYATDVYQQMGGIPVGHDHGAMAQHPPKGAVAIAAPLPDSSASETTMPTMDGAIASIDQIPTFGLTNAGDKTLKTADLVVDVTALQFAWIFNYPQQGITSGELHVPMGTDVQLNLKAQDVIHSFWVPQFRIKQDVIPGENTELRFKATRLGDYPIVCTELCGSYHGAMRTRVIVHSPDDYATWLKDNTPVQEAASDLHTAIALNPQDRSDAEFLAPYAHERGVDTHALAPLVHPDSESNSL